MSLQDQMGNTENKLEVLFPVVSKSDFNELLSVKIMSDQWIGLKPAFRLLSKDSEDVAATFCWIGAKAFSTLQEYPSPEST